jgi:hypothetical protein
LCAIGSTASGIRIASDGSSSSTSATGNGGAGAGGSVHVAVDPRHLCRPDDADVLGERGQRVPARPSIFKKVTLDAMLSNFYLNTSAAGKAQPPRAIAPPHAVAELMTVPAALASAGGVPAKMRTRAARKEYDVL